MKILLKLPTSHNLETRLLSKVNLSGTKVIIWVEQQIPKIEAPKPKS